MSMSYKHAWDLVEEMNRLFGKPVVAAQKGGRQRRRRAADRRSGWPSSAASGRSSAPPPRRRRRTSRRCRRRSPLASFVPPSRRDSPHPVALVQGPKSISGQLADGPHPRHRRRRKSSISFPYAFHTPSIRRKRSRFSPLPASVRTPAHRPPPSLSRTRHPPARRVAARLRAAEKRPPGGRSAAARARGPGGPARAGASAP